MTERPPRYDIVRKIASGGSADILLARMTGLAGFDKLVVLKRLHRHYARDPKILGWFLDEARLAARLNHHNIAQVYAVDRVDGDYAIVEEYLDGCDLHHLIDVAIQRGEVLPLPLAIEVVLGAAAGLGYAHDVVDDEGAPLRIVHRDVSPSNIILTRHGAVKLIDFGIATSAAPRETTRTGAAKGKPWYMAPEQVVCGAIDRRCDVYALAVVLYQATTMQVPFSGDNALLIMSSIISRKPQPPSRLVAGYPPELERIVMRGMATAPERRYPTVAAMWRDLASFATANGLRASAADLATYVRELRLPAGRARWPQGTAPPSGTAAPDEPTVVAQAPTATASSVQPPAPRPPRRAARIAISFAIGFLAGLGTLLQCGL